MPDARIIAFVTITTIVACGTTYSVINNTYLDTSNPLLTNLPHPLHKSHYFATKSNFLNVIFIKRAWGWTSAVFFGLWFTSPSAAKTKERIFKWLTATLVWFLFTGWFFGPALLERFIVASGGECILALPSGDPLAVPIEFCYTRTSVSPATHPALFTIPAQLSSSNAEWRATPRLRRGHDVSGHIFLLTLSVLFLVDQLRPSFRNQSWPSWHKWAVYANLIMINIWLFSSLTTSIYFHSPLEKVTGYLLGVAGFLATQIFETTAVKVHQS